MPVAEYNKEIDTTPVNNNDPDNNDYSDLSINLNEVSIDEIRSRVGGSKWVVDYYSNYHTEDTELSGGTNPNTTILNDQYLEIKDVELRVTTPLTPQTNEENESALEGTANIIGVIPNVGNIIVANVGSRKVQFTVTSVETLTIFKQSGYSISYRAIAEHSGNARDNLLGKVVKSTIFVLDLLSYGRTPILHNDEYTKYLLVLQHLDRMYNEYYRLFYNRDYSTFIVPVQDRDTYDPHMVQYAVEFTPRGRYTQYNSVEVLDVGMEGSGYVTVLDAIRSRSISMLYSANPISTDFTMATSCLYRMGRQYNTIQYSGIPRVYHISDMVEQNGGDTGETLVPSPSVTNPPLYEPSPLPDDEVISIYPVTHDDSYIFTEAFYNHDNPNMTMLENLVVTYIKGNSVSIDKLLALANDQQVWGLLEKYYYTHILATMLSSSIGDI